MGAADLRERILATALADPAVGDVHDIRIYIKADDNCIVTLHLKLDPEISLENAHEVSDRVETTVAQVDPKIITVYTHLEPLEAPVALRDGPAEGGLTGSIERILGRAPLRLDVRQSEVGPVALVTITTDPGARLAAAHALASDLERDLRIEHPELADVVVHTEPAASSTSSDVVT
jgi:divalent metal cation (Fe/Co/Zn/Cd) transporter